MFYLSLSSSMLLQKFIDRLTTSKPIPYVDLSVLSLLGCSYILTTVLIAPAAAVASDILVTKLIYSDCVCAPVCVQVCELGDVGASLGLTTAPGC